MKRSHITIFLIFALTCTQCNDPKRIEIFSKEQDQKSVQAILKVLDNNNTATADNMEVRVDDLVYMSPNQAIITDKITLIAHNNKKREYGLADMKHEIIEIHSYDQIVVMHGMVTGAFYPFNENISNTFKTKNLFVFRRATNNS